MISRSPQFGHIGRRSQIGFSLAADRPAGGAPASYIDMGKGGGLNVKHLTLRKKLFKLHIFDGNYDVTIMYHLSPNPENGAL